MRLHQLAIVAFATAVLSACTCADTVKDTRFACTVTADCLTGFTCRGGECRAGDDVPEGSCLPGETQACTITSCERPCGSDGGWASCQPASGPGFESNPLNCGECGRRCADRLTCIDARCTCATDSDCPSGDACLAGGVCGMNTDPCAHVTCATGSVCRAGSCAPVACSEGCNAGEICELGNCRPIHPCRFAVPCDGGGICEGEVKPDREACNDGTACSFGDSCTAGSCSGTAYSCPAPDQCQQAVACAGDGGCDITPATDGTPCDDGVACTAADQCVSGVCGGTAYTCSPNQCASTSVCAGDGGCDVTPRNVGAGCDDGVSCTFGDSCSAAGLCTGTTYSCPGVTECKEAGLCLGDGGCDVVNKPDSTPCDDGLACSNSDVCTGGACAGTPVTSYLDSDGDGRGNLATPGMSCPLTANFVLDGGDCNDSSPFVQNEMAAVLDVDRDGFTSSTTLNPTACVGDTSVVNGRTYYRSSTGAYTWLATASATADCLDSDPDVFETRPMMVLDADRDGYSTGATITPCVGTSSVINGRTYYANASGAFVYLDLASALGTDCLDSDADVFSNRSVALDVDHDGFTTTTSTANQCVGAPTVINTRTYYSDAAGNPNWLGSASATADCNDANAAITGTTTYYVDADADTFGAGTGTARCMPMAGEVLNNTDCNDANGFINTNRMVATDADNDSFTTTTTLATVCTGSSSVVNTRTYYRDAANALSQLGAASAVIDCNDANAAIFPQIYYVDADGDGRGAGAGTLQCAQTGFATNNTDCNDASANIFQFLSGVYDDADQDGYATGTPASLCVGSSTIVSGRTYYRNPAGAFAYTTTSAGTDCSPANALLFVNRANVVPDDDRDGYPSNATDSTRCAGATTTVSTRTYYAGGTGGYWMGRADCIQKVGAIFCDPAFVDCIDTNPTVNPGQAAFFTVHRGDGSFDYNCSGTITANSAANYCTSTTAGVATFTDATCVTSAGTATMCVGSTVFAAPAACGKFAAGANTFVMTASCVADTLATATVIGCR